MKLNGETYNISYHWRHVYFFTALFVGNSGQIVDNQVLQIDIIDSPTRPTVKEMNDVKSPDLDDVVKKCIDYCHERNIEDPVEILRAIQQFIVTGLKQKLHYCHCHLECLEYRNQCHSYECPPDC